MSRFAGPLKIFLIAGEPSGDRLGASLMRGLRAEAGDEVLFEGVGGMAMAAEGLKSLFDIRDIAVMGLAEVLPKLRLIWRRINETTRILVASAPDVVVTIDAPDFGLRVAARTRPRVSASTAFIHYVAPSVWAWRPRRALKVAKRVDHVMALLPFEPPYFERVGLTCDFVGHPVLEAAARVDPADQSFRETLGVSPDIDLLVALPGSRRGEVARLAAGFGETIGLLAERRIKRMSRRLAVVLPAAENVVEQVQAATANWPVAPIILDPRDLSFHAAETRKLRAMAAADVALAASGTVSLELAAMQTPMAIAYRTNALTAEIVRRLVLIDTATLVNLVSETRAVPEFIQEKFQPQSIAETLDTLLDPDNFERRAQLDAAIKTMHLLGADNAPPSQRAARSVLAAIDRKRAGWS